MVRQANWTDEALVQTLRIGVLADQGLAILAARFWLCGDDKMAAWLQAVRKSSSRAGIRDVSRYVKCRALA